VLAGVKVKHPFARVVLGWAVFYMKISVMKVIKVTNHVFL
jgi:hypothetical protein